MNPAHTAVRSMISPSDAGRRRLFSRPGEPLLLADWMRVLMMHFEVDADTLQRHVPFELDLRDGRAFISLVAFTMRDMRPYLGGKFTSWIFKSIATHDFLNVRTYVKHGGEPGIHFLAEWLSSRLAVSLGPPIFGLPYRHGQMCYDHDWATRELKGRVLDVRTGATFAYKAENHSSVDKFTPCEEGSLDEWLMERYTAFNFMRGRKKFFRIWHPPWPQQPVQVELQAKSLLTKNWPWFAEAALVGANYSPGVTGVLMGRPHGVK